MDGSLLDDRRGGAAVGRLMDLGAIEAGAVLCLRLWHEAPASPARMDFERDMGRFGGRAALEAIGGICAIWQDFGRRPMVRHHLRCDCLGADEACLAHMVQAALLGDRDDAMMLATLMVRADYAPGVVAYAERAGAALARLAATPVAGEAQGCRLH
ncbi:hypothetical protein [Maritimibacter dapengensis]|uniref:Uncharacterized protein n=1 Tax=Maritimibacter dapengensis TaxID=2836868 RepID=A0ABS6T0A4_9RHOB|nr:hypothetical protein [Maritimibacter dapengensis]MBV7378620.1 hypothetical protein [Maritimibacter dapengensis]